MRSPRLRALALCASSLGALQCGSAPEALESVPLDTRPSLVLVTLDTTRADRIGAYGHPHAHTPNLDQLATEGVRFEHAYTTVPLTTPAHASMLSGMYPPSHGIRTNGDASLPTEALTVAEVLVAEGWRTGASVAAFVTTALWGLDQGFGTYLDDVRAPGSERWSEERRADAVVDDALAWLDDGSGPFFLWVHLYDAHDPYAPPSPWRERFAERPYDGEIAFADEQIGRLRGAVEQAAGAGGAAWVVVGDHGEALDEGHGEQRHGIFLYDDTARVPLIVVPATPLESPRVEGEVVSVVDVWPTAMSLLGLVPPAITDGVDLTPSLEGPLPTRAPVYIESETPRTRFGWHAEVAVVDEGWKLLDTPKVHLFDLSADPLESTNVAHQHAARVAALQSLSAEVRGRAAMGTGLAPMGVDAQLQALGYITEQAGSDDPTVDIKDRQGVLRLLARASALAAANHPGAEAIFRQLLEHEPGLGEARLGLVRLLERLGRTADAAAELERAVELSPESTTLRLNLGRVRLGQRDPAGALLQADTVLAQVPRERGARQLRARALADAGDLQRALAQVQTWGREAPDDSGWLLLQGEFLARLGRMADAEVQLRRAADAPVPAPGAHRALANGIAWTQPLTAIDLLLDEIALYPDDHLAHRQLGDLRMELSDWVGAVSAYSEAALRAPTAPHSRRAWAQALFNTGDVVRAAEVLAPLLPSEDPHVLTLHANILAANGDQAEAEETFARAKALWQR